MNNNEQNNPVEKSNSKVEKRVWISPELNDWESVNIGAYPGGSVDGGAQEYIP
ncbi:hypothetical protein G9H61_04095 [Aquirufa ecclesiirivi]|uniref:Uncharacterized protein n=1 Tax=Aquirufa ecclesiirivi TaxID=2715124 RepID=A0ABT4JEP6_9BACT|nr:hypothetical protein [Aquirufa ecclesiirivi]MCZ2474612.1 hypothetical protein [Aquirufa ecclesiirivi]MDF0694710.1 hypothetical protein [Aquirufa ecclesiirivi]